MVAVDNPVIAERYRGGALESLHRGAWAVCDVDSGLISGAGDPDQPIFARSSSKSLQACGVLPLGIVDRFGLTSEHLAVMVSSHNGEARHVETVEALLATVGLDDGALRCGSAHPLGRPDATPSRLRHNCSGKHAGFLAGARALDQEPETYLDPRGPVQLEIRAAMQRIAQVTDADLSVAIDGCSAPTFALPLRKLATAIARISNPAALDGDDAANAGLILEAAAAHPELVAGTAPPRFDTDLIRITGGRLFAKGGADGVQVIGVRDAGVAFAGKVDDGNDRGLVPVALAVLHGLGHLSDEELHGLERWAAPTIRNADGLDVGEQRIAPVLP